jgi:hypothetical protein
MASTFTNRGLKRFIEMSTLKTYNEGTIPDHFYAQLISDTTVDVDVNTFAELNEITEGNGYTAGGNLITLSSLGFNNLTEDDDADTAYILLRLISWVASGGSIPPSGDPIAGMVLTADPDTDTTTINSREVLAWVDPGETYTVLDTYALEIVGTTITGAHS